MERGITDEWKGEKGLVVFGYLVGKCIVAVCRFLCYSKRFIVKR